MADTKSQLETAMATNERTCKETTTSLKNELDAKTTAERKCMDERTVFKQLVDKQEKVLKELKDTQEAALDLELSGSEAEDDDDELYHTSTLKF